MRKIYACLVITILLGFSAKAQYVAIPDTNFRNWLVQNYPACMSGGMMDTVCAGAQFNIVMDVSNLGITDLTGIQYFDNCFELNCSQNNLSELTALPPGLLSLDCHQNVINNIPLLPVSVHDLICSVNLLDSLPQLPTTMLALDCSFNNLTYLPDLPDSLRNLICNNNYLSKLPAIPPNWRTINCANNLIDTIPYLPIGTYQFKGLECYSNNVVHVTNLDDVFFVDVHDNPALACLPYMQVVNTIDFGNTAINCLPSYGNLPLAFQQLVPLCGILNLNGCRPWWNIGGEIYYDNNNNCVKDSTEINYSNNTVSLYDSAGNLMQQYIATYTGQYNFYTQTGTYAISMDSTDFPFFIVCPDSGYYTSIGVSVDSVNTGLDFALACKPGFDVGVTSVVNPTGIIRPANYAQIAINAGDISNFYNAHCATGLSGAIQVIINGPASYVSSNALPVSNVNGDTLTWNIADFGTVDFNSDFNITIHTDTLAQIGQQVCFEVTVTPTVGDNNISNNTLTHCFDVVNSYDPNDKTAYPSGDIDTAQEWMNYTIRFQNTGNAPAQHIYVMDTLDSDIDVSTFKLLAYSHDNITQVLPGGIIKFNFPNINLPDSFSNEPLSHGYVQYKVKLKENLPLGTAISNTAFIYFDFNAPVVTNTTVNTISLDNPIGIKPVSGTISVSVFPNPTTGQVTVQVPQSQTGFTLWLYNVYGDAVNQLSIAGNNGILSLASQPAGVYFIKIETANGSAIKKVVKQ